MGSQVCVAPAGERGTRICHFSFHQLLQLEPLVLPTTWMDSQASLCFQLQFALQGPHRFSLDEEELGTNGLLIRETNKSIIFVNEGFPGALKLVKESSCNAGDLGFDPCL